VRKAIRIKKNKKAYPAREIKRVRMSERQRKVRANKRKKRALKKQRHGPRTRHLYFSLKRAQVVHDVAMPFLAHS
jgi:hypothetical protein